MHDLIIVGGGPAGATAALFAQRAGLRTLLVDRRHFPRDKICGDAIGAKALRILRELGLYESLRRLPGVQVREIRFGSPSHVAASIHLNRARDPELATGFVIQRSIFDAFLFEQAREAGVACVEGFAVDTVLRESGQVVGVAGIDAASGERQQFQARLTLGADGCQSVVARSQDCLDLDPAHTILALRRHYQGVEGLGEQIELHYEANCLPGYFWIFPLPDGLANVGLGMVCKDMVAQRRHLARLFDDLVERSHHAARFAQARQIGRTVGWHLPVGSKRRRCHGAGFMLLGDAAGLIDPFTGEGIANAMFSAKIAIEAASIAIGSGDLSAAGLACYPQRLWGALGDELAVSTRLQRLGRVRPLLDYVIGKAARSQRVSDLICGMVTEEVPRRQLANPLFYLKLLAS